MNKTILQVPINRDIKDHAEQVALSQGFSSLQEVVRVFLFKFAEKKIAVTIQEPIYISEEAEKRYIQMSKDFEEKKDIYVAKSVNDLMKQLDADTLP